MFNIILTVGNMSDSVIPVLQWKIGLCKTCPFQTQNLRVRSFGSNIRLWCVRKSYRHVYPLFGQNMQCMAEFCAFVCMHSFDSTSCLLLEVLDVGKNRLRGVVFRPNRTDLDKVRVLLDNGHKVLMPIARFRLDLLLCVEVQRVGFRRSR